MNAVLHRVQLVAVGQAFDGRDLGAGVHDGEGEAGVNAPAVDQDGAGAALAVVAALLGAGQAQVLAQGVEQRDARLQLQLVLLAVDLQRDGTVAVGSGGGSAFAAAGRQTPLATTSPAVPARCRKSRRETSLLSGLSERSSKDASGGESENSRLEWLIA